jgi:hypothetical protein
MRLGISDVEFCTWGAENVCAGIQYRNNEINSTGIFGIFVMYVHI